MYRAVGLAFLLMVACASNSLDPPRPVSDDDLQAKVEYALSIEPRLFGTHILVSALNGTVELAGSVWTEKQRALAEDVARNVEGVRSVVNNIHL
jgi:osmotically-inducible protein OsmY